MAEKIYTFMKEYLTDPSGQRFYPSPHPYRVQDEALQERIEAKGPSVASEQTALRDVPGQISDLIALVALGVVTPFRTKALRDLSSPDDLDVAWVYNDDVDADANNGLWEWVDDPGTWSATTLQLANASDLAAKASASVAVSGGGLVTGGGDLSANRTLSVTEAGEAEAQTGTASDVVLTPRRGTDLVNQRLGSVTPTIGTIASPYTGGVISPLLDDAGGLAFGIDQETGQVHAPLGFVPGAIPADRTPYTGGFAWHVGGPDGSPAVGLSQDGALVLPVQAVGPYLFAHPDGSGQAAVWLDSGVDGEYALQQSGDFAALGTPVLVAPGIAMAPRLVTDSRKGEARSFVRLNDAAGIAAMDTTSRHMNRSGQSLSVEYDSQSASQGLLYTAAPLPDKLLTFVGGAAPLQVAPSASNINTAVDAAQLASLVDATGQDCGNDTNYINGFVAAGMVAQGPWGFRQGTTIVISTLGIGAQGIDTLDNDDPSSHKAYANWIDAMEAHFDLADADGLTPRTDLVWDHGEEDGTNGMTEATYSTKFIDNIFTPKEAATQAYTGQADFKAFVSFSSVHYGGAIGGPALALLALSISNAAIIGYGPVYPFERSSGSHRTSLGYVHRDSKLGQVYALWFVDGVKFLPTSMVTATRSGVEVTVTMRKFRGPLQIRDDLVTDPGNWGFTFHDDDTSASVISAEFIDAEAGTVLLTLDGEPTGANESVGLAYVSGDSEHGTPTTGPRSPLCDSDPFRAVDGREIPNFAAPQLLTVS